tara:strand:- start:144 stop:476 length:333 start_codon:yes stop_codon:yes gene_type:complete
MPFVNLSTSAKIEDKKKLLEEITILISSLTNKSKRFVMAKVVDNLEMYFEDQRPCCYLEIKSIGSLNTPLMSQSICSFVYEKIGIPKDKIYICFEDIPPELWGWNGKTFG